MAAPAKPAEQVERLRPVGETGWGLVPPAGFTALQEPDRLQWERNVLGRALDPRHAGGTHFEYIMAQVTSSPNPLMETCPAQAAKAGLGNATQTRRYGRPLLSYICPGHDYPPNEGNSHLWKCLLALEDGSAIELSFWATWLKVTDPRRLGRDRSVGLRAFQATCDSLAPLGASPSP